jgi:hypothetical protein
MNPIAFVHIDIHRILFAKKKKGILRNNELFNLERTCVAIMGMIKKCFVISYITSIASFWTWALKVLLHC